MNLKEIGLDFVSANVAEKKIKSLFTDGIESLVIRMKEGKVDIDVYEKDVIKANAELFEQNVKLNEENAALRVFYNKYKSQISK